MPTTDAPRLLVVLCGLPGSGKSSLCAALLAASPSLSPALCCAAVCFDDDERAARDPPHGGPFTRQSWLLGRAASVRRLSALLAGEGDDNASGAPASAPCVVLADDTAPSAASRGALAAAARRAGASALVLHACCPEPVAAARNAVRPAATRVPDAVFSALASSFEAPGGESERLPVLPVDTTSSCDAAALWGRVLHVWATLPRPPSPAPQDAGRVAAAAAPAATAASAAHSLDLASRLLVAAAVANGVRREQRCSMSLSISRECVSLMRRKSFRSHLPSSPAAFAAPEGRRAAVAARANAARRAAMQSARAGGVGAEEVLAKLRAACAPDTADAG